MLPLLVVLSAKADELPPTSFSGYVRLSARPDLVGGEGRLGTSPTYGRLLNEGPWGLLELRQRLVGKEEGEAPWGALRVRVEGGATPGGDPTNGSLVAFRVSQLHLDVGGIGPADVTWRLGTLETTFGDLWLFDARPTQMLVDVLGVSGTWARDGWQALVAAGDAGWSLHGASYHAVPSVGASLSRTWGGHLTVGVAGQAWLEPADGGDHALRDTPGLDREGWGDPAGWATAHPDAAREGEPRAGRAWKLAGTVGLSALGPLRLNRLQAVWIHPLPDAPVAVGDEGLRIGAAGLTDDRHELIVGDELELVVVPDRVEVAAAALYVHRWDRDDRRAASPGNGTALSGVVRAQVALGRHLSLLGETSLAHETTRGAPPKDTWQGKGGLVLSPAGPGLLARPALRLLYGAQRSSEASAWPGTRRPGEHWHHLLSLEGEAWF